MWDWFHSKYKIRIYNIMSKLHLDTESMKYNIIVKFMAYI